MRLRCIRSQPPRCRKQCVSLPKLVCPFVSILTSVWISSTVVQAANYGSADFDGDTDVDQADFGHFQTCRSGTNVPQTNHACIDADLDGDGDVDAIDFTQFYSCLGRSGVSASAECLGLDREPQPMNTAGRVSGVAPLMVVFDAVGSDSGVLQPSNGDFTRNRYIWNFGDASAGVWSITGHARNTASGHVAAHVFEQPGQYLVTLELTQPGGSRRQYYQTINVQPFTGTTYYVSSSRGSDNNNGLSENSAFKTWSKADSVVDSNTRILFRRGDTFSVPHVMEFLDEGPGIIGAYHTGNRPVLQLSSSADDIFQVRNRDWRVMDVELKGRGPLVNQTAGIRGMGTVEEFLALRVLAHNVEKPFIWSISSYDHLSNGLVDCEATNCDKIFIGGQRQVVMGCYLHDVIDAHVLRCWHLRNAVIAHNEISGGTKSGLKLHNPNHPAPEGVHAIVSDNRFLGSGGWTVNVGPENPSSDQRVRYTVIERNLFRCNSATKAMLNLWARNITVRNNIFIGDYATTDLNCIGIGKRGVEPAPTDNQIYHNTVYRGDSGTILSLAKLEPESLRTTLYNNIVSGPNILSVRLTDGGGTSFTEAGNLLSPSPGFKNAGNANFELNAGSIAIDTGVNFGSEICDFDVFDRPVDGDGNGQKEFDAGAFEYIP